MIAGNREASLTRQFDFVGRRGGHVGQRVTVELVRRRHLAHVRDGAGLAEAFEELVGLAVQGTELKRLDEEKDPGEDRGQHEADHNDLNDRVGFHEHAGRGQLAVSGLCGGLGLGSRSSGRCGGVSGRSGGCGGRSGGGSILRENRRTGHKNAGGGHGQEDVGLLEIEHSSPVPAV